MAGELCGVEMVRDGVPVVEVFIEDDLHLGVVSDLAAGRAREGLEVEGVRGSALEELYDSAEFALFVELLQFCVGWGAVDAHGFTFRSLQLTN